MTLAAPWILVLVLPTVFAALAVRRMAIRAKQALARYRHARPANSFWPDPPSAPAGDGPSRSRGGAYGFAGTCVVLGLAGMTMGTRDVPIETKVSPVILLVDISASMGVQDVAWGRLGAAKLLLRRLAPELEGVPIGLSVFADETHALLPPTVDQDLLLTYLDALDPAMVTGRGTALDRVLEEAAESATSSAESGPPTFVLISDGEDPSSLEVGEASARAIREAGGRLATLVTGTEGGGQVPENLLSPVGRLVQVGVSQARQGPAVSSADRTRMQRLAVAGGGPAVSVASPEGFEAFTSWLKARAFGRGGSEEASEEVPVDRWPWFILAAVLALLIVPGQATTPTNQAGRQP